MAKHDGENQTKHGHFHLYQRIILVFKNLPSLRPGRFLSTVSCHYHRCKPLYTTIKTQITPKRVLQRTKTSNPPPPEVASRLKERMGIGLK